MELRRSYGNSLESWLDAEANVGSALSEAIRPQHYEAPPARRASIFPQPGSNENRQSGVPALADACLESQAGCLPFAVSRPFDLRSRFPEIYLVIRDAQACSGARARRVRISILWATRAVRFRDNPQLVASVRAEGAQEPETVR